MSRGSWAASGKGRAAERGPAPRGARPAGSWGASVMRARATWDQLTGGPRVEVGPDVVPGKLRVVDPADRADPVLGYSDVAAAAILSTALGLWADTAASMAGPDVDGED